MKICPRCKFYNQDKNRRCLKCGWTLDADRHLPEMPLRVRRKPFQAMMSFLRRILWRLENFFTSPIPDNVPFRFPFVAAWLSLFFGLGQVYNRQYKKAAFFCIGQIMGLLFVIMTWTDFYGNWLLLAHVCFVLYNYNDGLTTALKINGQIWTWRNSLAAYSALFFFLGAGTILGQFFFFPVFKLIKITQPTLEPSIDKGDMVFVDCVTYWFRNPRRGEIIFYDPESFSIDLPGGAMGGDRIVVRETNTFEAVIGLPGEIIERRKGDFYLNGERLSPRFRPLLPDNIMDDFRFEIPENRYLAVFSHSPEDLHLLPMNIGPEFSFGSFGGRAPSLKGVPLDGWENTCLVDPERIHGRALFIFNPPPNRRFLSQQ